jgi:hypothetical protein
MGKSILIVVDEVSMGLKIEVNGVKNPVEVMMILGVAQQTVANKMSENSRIVLPSAGNIAEFKTKGSV